MRKTFAIFLCMLICISCKKDFLTEKPLSFFTSSNAFITYSDFNTAVNDMYRIVRAEFYTSDQLAPFDYLYSTDLVFDGQPSTQRHTNLLATFSPSSSIPLSHWLRIVAGGNPGNNFPACSLMVFPSSGIRLRNNRKIRFSIFTGPGNVCR